MSKWKEIRSNFINEDENIVYIDAWRTNKDLEEGKVIAKIDLTTKEVTYLDEVAKTDAYAQRVINEALSELEKITEKSMLPGLGTSFTNERLVTLLYNAFVYLKDEYGCDFDELEEELGVTEEEYKQIFEDYQDTICCTFGKDELREGLFENETKLMQIVDYIVDTACENTATGEWYIYAEDVYKALKMSKDEYFGLLDQVVVELNKRDEIVDVEAPTGGALDLRLDTDYCKKFEGRIYEYKNGELKKKDSLAEKIEEAAGRVESNVKSERENTIDKER